MHNCAQQIVFWTGIYNTLNNLGQLSKLQPQFTFSTIVATRSIWFSYKPFWKNICGLFLVCRKHFVSSWWQVVRLVRNIFQTQRNLSSSSSEIKFLRDLFSRFGVPKKISSDGEPEFTSIATKELLRTWNVTHWISSAYYPRSNGRDGRAEVAFKQAKRLLR